MTPTILIVGATGNTGRSVVQNLPGLLKNNGLGFRILGLTRSLENSASQNLAKLPKVEIAEKDWTTIDADWLRSQDVERIYMAPHNQTNQFVEESALYIAALEAGVKYIVKISTNLCFIGPSSPIYYGRAHWAIEELLSSPEFEAMQWTSLRPNIFTPNFIGPSIEWIKNYTKTGKQEILNMIPAENVPVGFIDPNDVGKIGANLLALKDVGPHNNKRYVLSGPEDVTGKSIVELMEELIGVKVEKVKFQDTDWVDQLVQAGYDKKTLPSIVAGIQMTWEGKSSRSYAPTAEQIIEFAPSMLTVKDTVKNLLRG